jgi:hypothetical protein
MLQGLEDLKPVVRIYPTFATMRLEAPDDVSAVFYANDADSIERLANELLKAVRVARAKYYDTIAPTVGQEEVNAVE